MLTTLYRWYGKRTVWVVAAVMVALLFLGLIFKLQSNGNGEEAESALPTVKTASAASLSGAEAITLLGTVSAVSEADIQSEAAGRVTSVRVTLGQRIGAGQVVATLENASERAAVIQAEGAYEAAQANASVSDVSVTQAETSLQAAQNSAVNTVQSAYTTVSNGFFTTIDDMYRDANSQLPILFIADGNGTFLRNERVTFQTILPTWQTETGGLTPDADLNAAITTALDHTERTRVLTDAFITALQNRDGETLNGVAVTAFLSEFSGLRASLDATIAGLQGTQTSLTAAEDALAQAEIGGTAADLSAANAQVKQALGSLRSAQANLAKTIMRSPIAGTVNELDVKLGDFVGSFTKVAKVANNNGLEINAFVGEQDAALIEVGQTVSIEGGFLGTISHIGAGIDSDTQKTEIKIATDTTELTNGDTVTVALEREAADEAINTVTVLPISAVKFTAEDGFVFSVSDGKLTEHPVALGQVRGGFVEVVDGVTPEMQIVIDARGLVVGSSVEAIN